MKHATAAVVVLATICVLGDAAVAAPRAEIVFGQEYTCGAARFIVRSCSVRSNTEFCKTDYINEATPGRFVPTELNRDIIEDTVGGCTLAGKPTQTSAGPAGHPGQAHYGAGWQDVTILGERGGLVHVRWRGGSESWWPADQVRGPQAPQDVASNSLPIGGYQCFSVGSSSSPVNSMNFSVTGPGRYRVTGSGATGSFSVGTGGTVQFTGDIRKSMPRGFTAVSHTYQGRPMLSIFGPGGFAVESCEHG